MLAPNRKVKNYFVGDFWHLQYPENRILEKENKINWRRGIKREFMVLKGMEQRLAFSGIVHCENSTLLPLSV